MELSLNPDLDNPVLFKLGDSGDINIGTPPAGSNYVDPVAVARMSVSTAIRGKLQSEEILSFLESGTGINRNDDRFLRYYEFHADPPGGFPGRCIELIARAWSAMREEGYAMREEGYPDMSGMSGGMFRAGPAGGPAGPPAGGPAPDFSPSNYPDPRRYYTPTGATREFLINVLCCLRLYGGPIQRVAGLVNIAMKLALHMLIIGSGAVFTGGFIYGLAWIMNHLGCTLPGLIIGTEILEGSSLSAAVCGYFGIFSFIINPPSWAVGLAAAAGAVGSGYYYRQDIRYIYERVMAHRAESGPIIEEQLREERERRNGYISDVINQGLDNWHRNGRRAIPGDWMDQLLGVFCDRGWRRYINMYMDAGVPLNPQRILVHLQILMGLTGEQAAARVQRGQPIHQVSTGTELSREPQDIFRMLTSTRLFIQNGEVLNVLARFLVQTGGDFYQALGMFLRDNYNVITHLGDGAVGGGRQAVDKVRDVILTCTRCYNVIMARYQQLQGQGDVPAPPTPSHAAARNSVPPSDDGDQQQEAETMARVFVHNFEQMYADRQRHDAAETIVSMVTHGDQGGASEAVDDRDDFDPGAAAAAAGMRGQTEPHRPIPPRLGSFSDLQDPAADDTSSEPDDPYYIAEYGRPSDEDDDPFGDVGVSFPSPRSPLDGGSISKKSKRKSKRKTKRKLNKKSKRKSRKKLNKKSKRKSARKSSRKKSKRLSRK